MKGTSEQLRIAHEKALIRQQELEKEYPVKIEDDSAYQIAKKEGRVTYT